MECGGGPALPKHDFRAGWRPVQPASPCTPGELGRCWAGSGPSWLSVLGRKNLHQNLRPSDSLKIPCSCLHFPFFFFFYNQGVPGRKVWPFSNKEEAWCRFWCWLTSHPCHLRDLWPWTHSIFRTGVFLAHSSLGW